MSAHRSGSWVLADLLNSTGLAGHPEEYFRPEFRQFWLAEWGLAEAADHMKHLACALERGTGSNGIFSAKLHWHHLEWLVGALRTLQDVEDAALTPRELIGRWLPNPKYIYLRRSEPARQAISLYRAIHSGQWFDLDLEAGSGDDATLVPDPEGEWTLMSPDLWQVRWLERMIVAQDRNWIGFFESQRIEPLRISYRELIDAPNEVVRGVLDFLGLDVPADLVVPTSRLVQQNDELSANWLNLYLRERPNLGAGLSPWPP